MVFYSGHNSTQNITGWDGFTVTENAYLNALTTKKSIEARLGEGSSIAITNIIELSAEDFNQFIRTDDE